MGLEFFHLTVLIFRDQKSADAYAEKQIESEAWAWNRSRGYLQSGGIRQLLMGRTMMEKHCRALAADMVVFCGIFPTVSEIQIAQSRVTAYPDGSVWVDGDKIWP